jgi:hypothetical protein
MPQRIAEAVIGGRDESLPVLLPELADKIGVYYVVRTPGVHAGVYYGYQRYGSKSLPIIPTYRGIDVVPVQMLLLWIQRVIGVVLEPQDEIETHHLQKRVPAQGLSYASGCAHRHLGYYSSVPVDGSSESHTIRGHESILLFGGDTGPEAKDYLVLNESVIGTVGGRITRIFRSH